MVQNYVNTKDTIVKHNTSLKLHITHYMLQR